MGDQIKLNKYISFGVSNFYHSNKQWIFGVTLNKEQQDFSSNSLYEDVALVRNKYEFNLWLVFIGLHITVLGKLKNIKIN